MTRPKYDDPTRVSQGARRPRLRFTVVAALAGALILPLTGALAAPTAQALPAMPSPGDFVTWHRVDVKSPGGWPGIVASGADGAIWYSDDNTGQLIRRDPVSGVMAGFSLGLGTTRVVAIAGAPDGAIWFSDMPNNVVGRLDPKSGAVTSTVFSGPSAWVARSIAFDSFGNAWMGGKNGVPGLTVVHPDGKSDVIADPLGRYPEALTVAPNGHVWYATDESPDIIDFDPATTSFTPVPVGAIESTFVADVEVSRAGDIWVITDKGISSFATDGTILSTSMLPSHPFLTKPTSLVAGEWAEMYFADGDGGYGRINYDDSLTLFRTPFVDGGTRSIAVDGFGAVWFTLESDHLAWF
ncbi:hypothetical protein ACEXOS_001515 [Herbiconiux sp. P16]|uniref:Vgb family protein n=1 Tax=Herbiconiux wuyangfengii TaxID=3342794 RepID=UPI0035B848A7